MMIGAPALAITLIGNVTALIAPKCAVPYLSANKEASAVAGMPEQSPKHMKKKVVVSKKAKTQNRTSSIKIESPKNIFDATAILDNIDSKSGAGTK